MQDKQRFFNNKSKIGKSASSEASLITLERSQKLDLLIHLITNLRQSLVVCGSSGIGKTTMLGELKTRKKDDWFVINILSTANLSLESFQHQLLRFLILNYSEYDGQELSTTLAILAKENKKVVVIMDDDSSLLVPNLISTLIQYATTNECLRIIFSLTHDDLEIKKTTDQLIDECHYIDIPPLTEKQCGIFLRNKSVQRDVAVSLSEVNEPLVRRIYHETHGVPGEIISKLPMLSKKTKQADYKWMGAIFFVAVVVTGGIGYLIFDENDSKKNVSKVVKGKINYQVASKNETKFKTSPQIVSPVNKVNSAHKINLDKKNEILDFKNKELKKDISSVFSNKNNVVASRKNENLFESFGKKKLELNAGKELLKENKIVPIVESSSKVDKSFEKIKNNGGLQQPKKDIKVLKEVEKVHEIKKEFKKNESVFEPIPVIKNETKKPKKELIKQKKITKKKNENKTSDTDDRSWVLKQPKQSYTMQLMVLSSRESAVKFLKKNKKLNDKLKFFKLRGKSKYVVIYGSFKDAQKLYKEMEPLPEIFKKAWVRKFLKIQKTIE